MLSATRLRRWLGLCALLVSLVGSAHAQDTRNVTLRLNTATLPDTTLPTSFIEVRGCVEGCEDNQSELPDGNVIAWDDRSTLEPVNVGGDYWEVSFQIPANQNVEFKFYSQQAEDVGIGGWEDNANHVIEAGEGDVDLGLHFFEKGEDKPYDWRPYEEKVDSVAVWFRVAMFGDEATQDGYDPALEAPDQIVGVRGDNLGEAGPLDWGATQVTLERESTNSGHPGYRVYSGVAYYPASTAGMEQQYKFVLEKGGAVGWEEGNVSGNRTFTVPANDTTLHWVYFGDTPPSKVDPVESLVIFAVDLSPFEEIGIFDRARGDTLWVFGSFNGWQSCPDTSPDDCLMQRVPGEDQFEAAVPMSRIPGTEVAYKYFLDFNNDPFVDQFGVEPPSGWEEGHLTGINRFFTFEGSTQQDLGLEYFNDITSANVIPEGVSVDVKFAVDMTPALTYDAQPFDPAGGDSVTVRFNDPIWAFTQGIYDDPRGEGDFPLAIDRMVLEDPDGDNIYEGTFTVTGPTYSALTFRYAYGQGSSFFEDQGTDTNEPGRSRTYFIKPNADGSWPAEYELPQGTFQLEAGPLPYETNPAISTGIEVDDAEIPASISLGPNYPNPFNPSTTFEYTVDRTQHVTVRVFDLLGRTVATLVDGVQQAATYKVTFDASDLASGVYLYQIKTPSTTITRRMVLVK